MLLAVAPYFVGVLAMLVGIWLYQRFNVSEDTGRAVSHEKIIPGLSPRSDEKGNIQDIAESGSTTEFLIDIHKQFGSIASFWLGKIQVVSLASPKLLKQVVHLFDRPVDLFKNLEPLIGPGSTQFRNGEYGQKMRKMADRYFSHGKLVDKLSMFQEVGEGLVEKWRTHAETGERIPLSEHSYDCVMKALTRYAFGDYFQSDDALHEFCRDYDHVFWILENFLVDGPLKAGSEEEKSFNEGMARMKTVVNTLLKERQEAEIAPEDKLFVDHLLDEFDNEDELFSDCISYLIAGSHTSGFYVFWALYHLANHPEVQEKCHTEICDIYKGGPIKWETMKEMKYLQAVLNETQRLTPLAPFAARYSEKDLIVGGYTVKANTPIFLANHTMHWDEKMWDSPQTFNPDRFLDMSKIEPFKFEPFGIGKRKCPGYRMADMEAQIFLILLLKSFKITLLPDQPLKYKFGILVKPDVEIYAIVEKR